MQEHQPCRFRPYKKGGRICGKCALDCKHGIRGRGFQDVLHIMLGDDDNWNWDAGLSYFTRARQAYCHLNDIAAALDFVFCKYELCAYARHVGWVGRQQKPAVYICNFYTKVCILSNRPAFIAALASLQAACRKRRSQIRNTLHGTWVTHNAIPINTEDPFSLQPIETIDICDRFSFMTDDGRLYGFSAPELSRYITTYNPINPLTREDIPEEAQERLSKIMSQKPLSVRQPIVVWRTPTDAFVDILHAYECYGFYTRLEWFSELSANSIYAIYYAIYEDELVPERLFNLEELDGIVEREFDFDEVENSFRYALVTTMRTIIYAQFPTKFHTVCRLFLAIADVNNIRGSMPQWIITSAEARALDDQH